MSPLLLMGPGACCCLHDGESSTPPAVVLGQDLGSLHIKSHLLLVTAGGHGRRSWRVWRTLGGESSPVEARREGWVLEEVL